MIQLLLQNNVNYTNTTLSAENGNLTINSFDDAAIKGADLIAENILLNTGNNLDIESLQNKDHSKSKSTSIGAGGGQNSVSLNYSASRSKFDRDWVDDQTSIIGTNSVTINTGNNTSLIGAVVANITNATKDDITKQGQEVKDAQKDWVDGGNLAINTKSLTFQDITDTEKQESSAIGIDLTVRTDNSAQSQDKNYYPKGSASLALQDEGYEREQKTKATIGQGSITTGSDLVLNFDANPVSGTYGNLLNKTGGATLADNDPSLSGLNRDVTKTQEITKDTITAALNASATIDLRLLDPSGKGQQEIWNEVTNLPENLQANAKLAMKMGVFAGYAAYVPVLGIYNYAANENLTASNALYATGKNYSHLYNLANNSGINSQYFVGYANLLPYDGNSLQDGADAKGAEGFYDRKKDVAAINLTEESNQTDSKLAGTLAHEGVHREMSLDGKTYNSSEEAAAHLVGGFVEGAWDVFQSDNTALRSSVPGVSYDNNNYLNNVAFGQLVNPLLANELLVNSKRSSPYTESRMHPTLKIMKKHNGGDYVPMTGDKSIPAAGDGVVAERGFQEKIKLDANGNPVLDEDGNVVKSGWGNYIAIEHFDEKGNLAFKTRYAHMATLPTLKIGDDVKEGQIFGTVGATGGVKGEHLHFETQKYNRDTRGWDFANPENYNVGKYKTRNEVPKQ